MGNSNILQVIKQAAVEAVNTTNPTGIMFGTVENVSPLKINVEQKMTLTKEFLILTHNVIDYDVDMTVDHATDSTAIDANHNHTAESSGSVNVTNDLKTNKPDTTISGSITATTQVTTSIAGVSIGLTHNHTYTGKKRFRVHNGLKKGDNVVLIQVQGGQKFIVLDKVVSV